MNRNIFIHQTQPVYIPEDAGVARDVLQGVVPAHIPKADAEEIARCDARTLFYDMFFESGDLILLGPPLLNLGLPLSIRHQGRRLRFRNETTPMYRAPSILRLKLKLPPEQEQLDLEFRFRDFRVSASCRAPQARPLPLSRKEASLVTLQKDNPVEWLRDWLLWHHRVHGVQRAVIYDNGSAYFSELPELLAGLDEGLEIILVSWPFPYGSLSPPLMEAKYCRVGALNHFRMFFGDSVRWGINLDVDEYLYQPDAEAPALMQYLMQPEVVSEPTVYLGSWLFPADKRRGPEGSPPRFFHHSMRYREEHRPFMEDPKYIFQIERTGFVAVHESYAHPFPPSNTVFRELISPHSVYPLPSRLPSNTAFRGLIKLIRMCILAGQRMRTRLLSHLPGGVADDPRNSKSYMVRGDLNLHTRLFLFLHFHGLYTHWRSSRGEQFRDHKIKRHLAAARAGNGEGDIEDVGELNTETIPADWLEEEPGVMETAARVGLAPPADRARAQDEDAASSPPPPRPAPEFPRRPAGGRRRLNAGRPLRIYAAAA